MGGHPKSPLWWTWNTCRKKNARILRFSALRHNKISGRNDPERPCVAVRKQPPPEKVLTSHVRKVGEHGKSTGRLPVSKTLFGWLDHQTYDRNSTVGRTPTLTLKGKRRANTKNRHWLVNCGIGSPRRRRCGVAR